ncbi:MAG: carbohydrate porin [Gallionellaceae bacterium]|jgi:maltoporin
MKTANPILKLSLIFAALAATFSCAVQAGETKDFEFSGYTRGGAYTSPAGTPRGGYTLGGDMQKFRLGNEGDNGIEVGLGKTFNMEDGSKWNVMFMPAVWGGKYGAAQAYAAITGLDFAPEAVFWGGQRRLRIQDVHIVDHFFMDYGENTGAGMTDYNLGFAKLGVGAFNSANFDNSTNPNNALRFNVDLSDIKTSAKGTLRLLATLASGNFQLATPGAGLSLLHNQDDFLFDGLNNTVFVQSASGHVALSGKFLGLGDAATGSTEQPGAQSMRLGDAINWQSGAFGGQALIAYQTAKVDGGVDDGKTTTDFSLGGRVSYAFTRNFKILGEAATTTRDVSQQAQQQLHKFTLAPTLTLTPDFWSRPELRLYVTYASWNDAAALANTTGFGAGGRTSSVLTGAQMEVWW